MKTLLRATFALHAMANEKELDAFIAQKIDFKSDTSKALFNKALGNKKRLLHRINTQNTQDRQKTSYKMYLIAHWIEASCAQDTPWLHQTTPDGTPRNLTKGLDYAYAQATKHFFGSKTLPSAQKHEKQAYGPYKPDIYLENDFPITADQLRRITLFGCEAWPHLKLEASASNNEKGKTEFSIYGPTHTFWYYKDTKNCFYFMGWGTDNNNKDLTKGLTKRLFANRIALAHALGANMMNALFAYIGAYAFARSGFLPQNPDKILGDIKDRTTELATLRHITPKQSAHIIDILHKDQNDPKTLWQIADLRDQFDGHPLGFHLLQNNMWAGFFDLNNPAQISRARNYTGPAHFDDVMQLAENIKQANKAAPKPQKTVIFPIL